MCVCTQAMTFCVTIMFLVSAIVPAKMALAVDAGAGWLRGPVAVDARRFLLNLEGTSTCTTLQVFPPYRSPSPMIHAKRNPPQA